MNKQRFNNLEVGDAELSQQHPQRLHVAKQLVDRIGMDKQQVQEMADAKFAGAKIIAPTMELEKAKRELRARIAEEEDRKKAERAAGRNPTPAWTAPDRDPVKKLRRQRRNKFVGRFKRVFLR